MSWWYCLITSSGVGPVKKYNSTTPPITLVFVCGGGNKQ